MTRPTSCARLRPVFTGSLLLTGLMVLDAAALDGVIRNAGGKPLARAEVSLVSDPAVRDTTDSTGLFTLTPTALTPERAGRGGGFGAPRLTVRDGRVRFELATPAARATINLFSQDGRVLLATPAAPLNAGVQHIALPRLTTGVYSLRLTVDGLSTVWRLAVTDAAGMTASSRVSDPAPVSAQVVSGAAQPVASSPDSPGAEAILTRTAGTAAAVDTLLVTRAGYALRKFPVASYGASDLTIIMTADTVSPLAPVTDYGANGPFTTVVEANVGPGNNYTIIRPETLGENGLRHAPLIYGHGINGQVSTFTGFLRVVASHGFVIIARNVLTGDPNNAANTAAMNDGLDWILAQDTTPGSVFFGKLATDRAAAMGYSVGGTAAVDIGGHPAIRTVVSIHGHISSAVLSGPLLQTSGTQDNVGLPMQEQTFANSAVQTFLGTVTGAGHGYIQSNNGGVQRAAIIAWLRFWVYHDQGGKHYFYGEDCVMCSAPWENPQRKNWD